MMFMGPGRVPAA